MSEIDLIVSGNMDVIEKAGHSLIDFVGEVWPEAISVHAHPALGFYRDAEAKALWDDSSNPTRTISHLAVVMTAGRGKTSDELTMRVTLGDPENFPEVKRFYDFVKGLGLPTEEIVHSEEELIAMDEKTKEMSDIIDAIAKLGKQPSAEA